MNKRISVGAAANYIVSLYDKLDNEYKGTATSVNMIVFIANLKYYYETGKCFLPPDTQYFNYPPSINGLIYKVRDFISFGERVDEYNYLLKEKHKLTCGASNKNTDFHIEEVLTEIENMDLYIKNILLETFMAFGSFNCSKILEMYLEIKNVSKFKDKENKCIVSEPELKNLLPTKIVENDLCKYITGSNIVVETRLSKESIDFIEDVLQMSLEQFNSLKYSEKEEVSNRIKSQKIIEK